MHNGRKITFAPLTPTQVYEDQVRIQQEFDNDKENKKMLRVKRKEKK